MIALLLNRLRSSLGTPRMERSGSLLLICALSACTTMPSPRSAGDHELRPIMENRAIAVIREVVSDAGLRVGPAMDVQAGAAGTLNVDVAVLPGVHGIEWVSAQDRVDDADVLPAPAPEGQLRIMAGVAEDAERRILVLDASTYRFDPERLRVQQGAVGLSETEGRLRRDVRDFLEYIRR